MSYSGEVSDTQVPSITNDMVKLATDKYYTELATVLQALKDGQPVNINEKHGLDNTTALHQAAALGEVDILKILLSKGAEVDIQKNGGITPLFSAAEAGKLGTVKALLVAGAVQDKTNGRALGIAKSKYKATSNPFTPEQIQEYKDIVAELKK